MSSIEIAAFVLAGGRSSRMGSDKALLLLDGVSLVERALALARSVSSRVSLVGSPEKLAGFGPVVEDIYKNCGPLGGIHAALNAGTTELNLILAVDVPFVTEEFLHFLVESAKDAGVVVTLPRLTTGWQPLCAVYHKAFAKPAAQALSEGRNRIDTLFSSVSVRAIGEAELRQLAFDPLMFDNLNTPEDWQRARQRIPRHH